MNKTPCYESESELEFLPCLLPKGNPACFRVATLRDIGRSLHVCLASFMSLDPCVLKGGSSHMFNITYTERTWWGEEAIGVGALCWCAESFQISQIFPFPLHSHWYVLGLWLCVNRSIDFALKVWVALSVWAQLVRSSQSNHESFSSLPRTTFKRQAWGCWRGGNSWIFFSG